LIDVKVAPNAATFDFSLNRNKLREARRREGRYLLRTNLCGRAVVVETFAGLPLLLFTFFRQLVKLG
jgi:hypothetical protein